MTDMIVVALRRPWWNQPELKLYPRAPEGVEIPAEYEDVLPSTSRVLSDIEVKTEKRRAKKAKVKEPDTMSALSKTLPLDFPEK